jgi:hypothetical protein
MLRRGVKASGGVRGAWDGVFGWYRIAGLRLRVLSFTKTLRPQLN